MSHIHELGFFRDFPLPYKDNPFNLNLYANKITPFYRKKNIPSQNLQNNKRKKNGFMFETMNINNYKQVLKGQIISEETGILDSLLTKFRSKSIEKYNNRNKRKKVLLKFIKEPERKLPDIDFSPRKPFKTKYGRFYFPSGYIFDSSLLNDKLSGVLNEVNTQKKNAEIFETQLKKNLSQKNILSDIKVKLGLETKKKEELTKSQSYANFLKEQQREKLKKINQMLIKYRKEKEKTPKKES